MNGEGGIMNGEGEIMNGEGGIMNGKVDEGEGRIETNKLVNGITLKGVSWWRRKRR